MCCGKKGNPADDAANREAARQANIASGRTLIDKTLAGFGDDFYTGREKAYLDFAAPQIDQQFADAKKQLLLALARAGLSGSSSSVQRFGRLQQDYDTAKMNAADKAKSVAAEARKNVERARGDLYNQLFVSADPAAAAAAAAGQADALNGSPVFEAVGPLFQNAAAGIGAYRAGQERGRINDILQSALGNNPSSSVRLVS